jgi:hypothetical protein
MRKFIRIALEKESKIKEKIQDTGIKKRDTPCNPLSAEITKYPQIGHIQSVDHRPAKHPTGAH